MTSYRRGKKCCQPRHPKAFRVFYGWKLEPGPHALKSIPPSHSVSRYRAALFLVIVHLSLRDRGRLIHCVPGGQILLVGTPCRAGICIMASGRSPAAPTARRHWFTHVLPPGPCRQDPYSQQRPDADRQPESPAPAALPGVPHHATSPLSVSRIASTDR